MSEADLVDHVKRHMSAPARHLLPPVPSYYSADQEAFVAVAALQRACDSDTLSTLFAIPTMAPYLAAALQRNRSIAKLVIPGIKEHVQDIVRALETHPSLTDLHICITTDQDLAALTQLLERNPRIRKLRMNVAVNIQLRLTTSYRNLHSLCLAHCELGDDQPFGELISTSQSLRCLDISRNKFTSARHIASALANTKTRLRVLNMGQCHIMAQEAHHFSKRLVQNFSLTHIEWTSQSRHVREQMAAVLRRNKSILREMQAAMINFVHCSKALFSKDLQKHIYMFLLRLANEWDDHKLL